MPSPRKAGRAKRAPSAAFDALVAQQRALTSASDFEDREQAMSRMLNLAGMKPLRAQGQPLLDGALYLAEAPPVSP